MLILDDRIWSDYSCTTRPAIIFVLSLTTLIVAGLLNGWAVSTRQPAKKEATSQRIWVGSRIAYWSAGSVIALALAAMATIVALAPNLTYVWTDGRFLVENGCFQLRPYETQIEIESAVVEFQRHDRKRGGRGLLHFRQNEKQISINLNTVYRDDVFVRIAPDAMREFAQTQQAKGKIIHPAVRALLED